MHVASTRMTLELFVVPLEAEFTREGYRFFYAFDSQQSKELNQGNSALSLKLPRGSLVWTSWVRNWNFVAEVARREIDVVHVHTPATALALYPHLLKIRNGGVKIFYTARGGFDEGVGGFRRMLWRVIDPLRWPIWHGVGVINSALAARASRFHSSRNITRLSFGGASPNIQLRTDREVAKNLRSERSVSLAWVGRFAADKKLKDFVELLEMLNTHSTFSFRGIVIGAPNKADRASVSKAEPMIENLGWVECPQKILRTVDALVSTSIREGYGLTVLEAALVGTPAFVYRTRGTVESAPITLSRLVPSGDLRSLRDAILVWAGQSESEKQALRRNVRWVSQKAFNNDLLVSEMIDAYASLISVKSKRSPQLGIAG